MNKKLILLPLALLTLAACGTTSSSTQSSSSSTSSSSSAPYVDNTVYRLVGSMNGWDPANEDEAWILVKKADENVFELTTDFFEGDEFAVTLNGVWDGQLGFSGNDAAVFSFVDDTPANFGEGGGYDVKNFLTLNDGNYKVTLELTVDRSAGVPKLVRELTIHRLGEPVNPPVKEVDTADWVLVGTMNSWNQAGTEYPLAKVEGKEHEYSIEVDLEANAAFKVLAVTSGWTYARGNSTVAWVGEPAAWFEAGSDNNIVIKEAGTYIVTLKWEQSIGGKINGNVFLSKIVLEPVAVPAVNLLAGKEVGAEVVIEDLVILGNVDSYLFGASPEGTVLINYYNLTKKDATEINEDLKALLLGLEIDDHISITANVVLGAGLATGAPALDVLALTPITKLAKPTFIFGTLVAKNEANPFDMTGYTGNKADVGATHQRFIDELVPRDNRGLLYKFTNVQFLITGDAANVPLPTNTNFAYFNVGTSSEMRVGIYKHAIPTEVNTTSLYTVYGVVVGSRASNDLWRVAFMVVVTEQPSAPVVE